MTDQGTSAFSNDEEGLQKYVGSVIYNKTQRVFKKE